VNANSSWRYEEADRHPANGLTQWFPQPGEAIVTAYGDVGTSQLAHYLDEAFRIVERNTGKRPDGGFLMLRDGVIQVRVTETP
jgi:hypothetical protein